MALFNFGKKKEEEKKVPACACNSDCASSEVENIVNDCCTEAAGGALCCIKVLGSGCKSCHALLENTKEAVSAMGLSISVEYVTEIQQIMTYGVMSVPALVVNDRVASMGKVLKAADVEKLLHKLGF